MNELLYISGLVFAFILGLFLKSYLPAYFTKKGENLATKEDIGKITQIVEQIKTDLSKDLEFVKWELGKKAAIHKLVAEKEITAISEIGNGLFDLVAATNNLRPIFFSVPEGQTKEQNSQQRYDHWVEKHNVFENIIEKHKLFLPKYIFDKFDEVRKLAVQEEVSFAFAIADDDRPKSEIPKDALENIRLFRKAVNEAAEMIHQRYEIEGLDNTSIALKKNSQS